VSADRDRSAAANAAASENAPEWLAAIEADLRGTSIRSLALEAVEEPKAIVTSYEVLRRRVEPIGPGGVPGSRHDRQPSARGMGPRGENEAAFRAKRGRRATHFCLSASTQASG
jgi:hypothetical protein